MRLKNKIKQLDIKINQGTLDNGIITKIRWVKKVLKNIYYNFDHYYKNINIRKWINTNNIKLSFHLGENNKLTIISAIDNLLKGAAGQAVQNMNVMFGYDELTALTNE